MFTFAFTFQYSIEKGCHRDIDPPFRGREITACVETAAHVLLHSIHLGYSSHFPWEAGNIVGLWHGSKRVCLKQSVFFVVHFPSLSSRCELIWLPGCVPVATLQ